MQTELISLNDNSMLNLVNGGFRASLNGYTVGFNLINNLKNSKTRKLFNTETGKTGKIVFDIKIDDIFDGSYSGNPYDKYYAAHLGCSMSRFESCQRLPVTYVVCNKKSSSYIDLSKFSSQVEASKLEALNSKQQNNHSKNYQMQSNKAFNCATGTERIYYHTTTFLPVFPDEISYDSDEDLVPDWLKEQTEELINDFTDMNDGEKGIMRLWNLFSMKHNLIGASQVMSACEQFVEENAEAIAALNLRNNFMLLFSVFLDCGNLTFMQYRDLNLKLNKLISSKKNNIS
jgi:polycomb protein SUZ12